MQTNTVESSTSSPDQSEGARRVSRRMFLRALGAAGSSVLLAACGGAATPPVLVAFHEITQIDEKNILIDDRAGAKAGNHKLRRVVVLYNPNHIGGSIGIAAEFPTDTVLTRLRAEETETGKKTPLPPGIRVNKNFVNEPDTESHVYYPITNSQIGDTDLITIGVGNNRNEAARGARQYRVVHSETGLKAEFVVLQDLDPNEKEIVAPA